MDFSAQGRQGWIVILGLLLMAGGALAQSRTAPVDPSAWNERLEIGPVEGLTTAWHRAPRSTAVPLGTTVELRVRASWSAPVVWSGAREVHRDAGFSIAEVDLDRPGPHLVRVEISDLREEGYRETVHFEVVDLGGGPVQVKDLRLVADEVVVDPERPNASSMQYFFRGGSIAELSEDAPGYYVTSTKRWVTAVAKVEPAGFAPLLEWRLDGEPLAQLGAQVRLQSFVAREHLLEAGVEGLTLETYRVHITSHESRTQIPDGVPVTFSARTEPPGYEERITWLASTKTGTCTPAMGEGAEFTVTFEGTTGAAGRWLGVRPDNAVLSVDQKDDSVPSVLNTLDSFFETGERVFEFSWPARSASALSLGIVSYRIAVDFDDSRTITLDALDANKDLVLRTVTKSICVPLGSIEICLDSTGPTFPLLEVSAGDIHLSYFIARGEGDQFSFSTSSARSTDVQADGSGGSTAPFDVVTFDANGDLVSRNYERSCSPSETALANSAAVVLDDAFPRDLTVEAPALHSCSDCAARLIATGIAADACALSWVVCGEVVAASAPVVANWIAGTVDSCSRCFD